MTLRYLSLLLLFILWSCQSAQVTTRSSEDATPTSLQEGILFLSLEVEKVANELQFKVLSSKTVAGKLKRTMPPILPGSESWFLEFLDEQDKVVKGLMVENPLTRSVEVSNESGRFQRQRLNLDKASFVVRIEYFQRMRKLRVSEPTGEVLSVIELDL